ncbi:hypothetical protein D3C87_124030 [compost metagenome]
MKNALTALVAMTLLASVSLAQDTTSSKMAMPEIYSSKGIRVSLLRPALDAKLKFTMAGESATAKGDMTDFFGLGVGYANLPVGQVGWTGNVAYLKPDVESGGTAMLRGDGNVAYTFTRLVNVKGGLNVMKIIGNSQAEKFNAGIGAQASVGLQLTRNFGLDLGYVMMRNSAKLTGQGLTSSNIDVELETYGFEIGLNGTF